MGVRVGNFCYFLSLETGVMIIGGIEILFGVLFLIAAVFDLLGGSVLQAVVGILQGVFFLITGLLLILGVLKRMPQYFGAFLVGIVVFIITYSLQGITLGSFITVPICIVVGIYFWIVVFSLYKSMTEGTSPNNSVP